ncbi:MAG: hypothetical protein HY537_00910 [Deltaproteobacteria bacterium]|nr:hypothetical protein [Deltaproteobacteria bacterium]
MAKTLDILQLALTRKEHALSKSLAVGIILCISYLGLWLLGQEYDKEALYLALSKRFILGDRPFYDDINIIQTGQLVSLPLFRLYHFVAGGFEGMALFGRHLYWLLMGFAVILCVRVGGAAVLISSLLFIVFWPFRNSTISYYSLGLSFFLIGRLLGLTKTHSLKAFLNGICDAIVAIAFFPLSPAALLASLWNYSRCADRKKLVFSYLSGLVLLLVSFFIYIEISPLKVIMLSMVRLQGFGHRHFLSYRRPVEILTKIVHYLASPSYFFVALSFPLILRQKINLKLQRLVFALVPLLLWWPNRADVGGLASHGLVIYLMFLVPFLMPSVKAKTDTRKWFYGLWLPALLAGFTAACFSNTNIGAMAIGFLPGAFLALFYISLQSRSAWLCSFFILLSFFQFQFPVKYSFSKSMSWIGRGPFKGILAPCETVIYHNALISDLENFSAPDKRSLIIPNDSMANLASSLRPGTNNLWQLCQFTDGIPCQQYYEQKLEQMQIVVWIDRAVHRFKQLRQEVENRCTLSISKPRYEIFDCSSESGKLPLRVDAAPLTP